MDSAKTYSVCGYFGFSFSFRTPRSTSGFTGFIRKASISLRWRLPTFFKSGDPVMTMRTVLDEVFCSTGRISVPSISGKRRSINAASKQFLSIWLKASMPVCTVVTM